MNLKAFLPKLIIFSALFLCVSAVNLFSQTLKTEKTGSVAPFVRDRDEGAGIVRKRTVESENVKINSSVKPSVNELPNLEKLVLSLINQKRADKGLPPLAWSEEVAKIARLHSENMVKFNFFGHK